MDSEDPIFMGLLKLVAELVNADDDNGNSGGIASSSSSSSTDSDVNEFVQAAANGDEEACESFLRAGGGVDVRNSAGSTALHAAAYKNQLGVATLLIKEGAELNSLDNDGDTPLICAVIKLHDGMVELLLTNGAEVGIRNEKRLTAADVALMKQNLPLVQTLESVKKCLQFDCELHSKTIMAASQEGNFDIIEYWLANHPNRRICDYRYMQDRTIAFVAALNNNTEILQLLSSLDADFELPDKRGHTPLFCAAQEGHYETAEFLLKAQGCDANKRSSTRRTPIFTAVIHGHCRVVELLLRNGADVNRADEEGTTPIELAVRHNNSQIFELLVKNKADLQVVDNDGYDLMMTAAKCVILDMLKLLHRHKVPIDRVSNKNGETPLLIACQFGDEDCLKFLISNGGNVNHRNHNGVSPALRAAFNGHSALVKILAEAKAQLDLPNVIKETAILCAAQQNSLEMVKYLADKGCKLDVVDKNGKTLAWYAAKKGNVEMLRFLREKGVSLEVETEKGFTPLMKAVEAEEAQAVRLLVELGCSRTRKTKAKKTAMQLGMEGGNREVIEALQCRPATANPSRPSQNSRLPSSTNSHGMILPSRPIASARRTHNLDANFKEWQILGDDKKPVGEGAFGKVYRAFTDKQQFVAVKIVSTEGLSSSRREEIIKSESAGVNLLSRIDHPNILLFLKCEVSKRTSDFCIFTELIAGISLTDLMKQRGQSFEEVAVVKFSKQICAALNYLHTSTPPILHRDIKGSNIMLTHEGVIKLIDFGLAKEIVSNSSAAMLQTSTQCGTLVYMAPELFLAKTDGKVSYTPMSDVWAFGCTIYELCTTNPPNIDVGNVQQFMLKFLLMPMPGLPSEYSKLLKDFYKRCVEKDVDSRATTGELLAHQLLLRESV